MKTKTFITAAFLIFGLTMSAQEIDLPKKAKPGKCYLKMVAPAHFNYNIIYTDKNMWKEAPCNEARNRKSTQIQIERYKSYQKMLKGLGYDLNVTGKPDKKFIAAHNKYIKQQQNTNKKRRKIIDSL